MSDETAEEREEYYPLKTLHNFLQEIDREWDSFKTAAIIGIILLVTLMAFTSYRLLMFIHMLRAGMKILRILDEILFTALIFAFVIYVEGMRVEIPISHGTYRGFRSRMPIKLLYVSNIPVILTYAIFANFQLLGQFTWTRWNRDNSNLFLNMLGMYNQTSRGTYPIGGLIYYTTSPGSTSRPSICRPMVAPT